MIKKIVNCVNYIELLNMYELNKLNIGIEIQDFTEPNLSDIEIRSIVSRYKKAFIDFKGIKSLHGPFLDLKPASPDLSIREVSYKRYLTSLNIAAELEMDYIIFHSQINPYLNQPSLRLLNNRQSKEFWDRVLSETSYRGIILIENIFEERPEILKEYIETIDRKDIRINLDIGHAKLGKVSLETWIRELKDYIVYMHIHSNDGVHDSHQTPNELEVEDLYSILEKYDLNPVLSLEYDIEYLEKEIKKYV